MSFEEEDRFSVLPDSVLCHILSFLPTKDAVRTKVLSSSLKGLPLQLKGIQIHHNVDPQMIPFIDNVLESEAGPLTHFILEAESLPEHGVMKSWLNVVLSRTTKVIHIVNLSGSEHHLPPEMFLSGTLEELKVCGRGIRICFPKFAHCPNLKVLRLKILAYMVVSNEPRRWSKYLSFDDKAYPLLENLDLEIPRFDELDISITTLKRLRLTLDWYYAKVKIYTPHLEHLDFMVSPNWESEGQKWVEVGEIQFRKCQSLLSATVGQFNTRREFMDFLMRINNVKKLHYLEHRRLDFNLLAADLLRFPNLTHLKLTDAREESARFFQDRAPNLEMFEAGHHGANSQG